MNKNGSSHAGGVVTVGVDGSEAAAAALHWAAAEARLRRTRLRVVHAWKFSYPAIQAYSYAAGGGSVDELPSADINRQREAAEDLVDHAIAELGAEADGLEIDHAVLEGPVAEMLVGAVTDDDLLVVGSRGRGGFTGLLLGSVSQQCAHRAPCPVVIVRTGSRPADESRSGRPGATESDVPA